MRTVTEVVAAAIVDGSRLLLAQRTRPPEFAGMWELPGGKVEDGETPAEALVRELREELGIEVVAGERVGADVPLNDELVLRAYRVEIVHGTPEALEHSAIRWFDAADLPAADLVPNDQEWLPDLLRLLEPS